MSDFGPTLGARDSDATLKSLKPPSIDQPVSLAAMEFVCAERERIAAHLHDEVMQSFATCFLNAQLCERLLLKQQYELAGKELLVLQDRLTAALDGLRELVATLRE